MNFDQRNSDGFPIDIKRELAQQYASAVRARKAWMKVSDYYDKLIAVMQLTQRWQK